MSTQLRLVETPSDGPTVFKSRRARAVPTRRARRAAHWRTSWRLDAKARRVGREGVAAARQALVQATDREGLSKAS